MLSFLTVVLFTLLTAALWVLASMLLSRYKPAAHAVLKRNFVSYFSSPTGYVFICVFVLLGSWAAFWPNEFFNANLANLNQLNQYLPLVLLVFIPAITMSIWAEERRQGTDELLLTIPAGDFDIVLGKYLSAVAIFTVSIGFSMYSTFLVLEGLGNPDVGLFLGSYTGYWLVGLAMLAIGMVASFLTSNLTVGFILGALFNVPLVFASSAEVIISSDLRAVSVKEWSIAERFLDFGRGVVSLSSVAYFFLIVVVMFYLSVVLIGRRHWLGGRDGSSMLWHYIARASALVVVAVAASVVARQFDARLDVTSERLTSLSPDTRRMLAELSDERPVQIEAFISPTVPETYVQTRLNLLAKLREVAALGGDKVSVRINETGPFSEAAERAEQQFGIESRRVASRQRGAMSIDDVYLGVAFTSGLDKVVAPFFDIGVPVEYELIRSVATVSQQQRKKVGVLTTDAQLFGQFNPQMMSSTRNEQIIEELEKQYEVVQVNPDAPIIGDYDVLLAVQPSSLSQPQMNNFIAAVRGGLPTAIFEDPLPYLDPSATPTSVPKRPPGGMFGMQQQQQPIPKGDIRPLWDLLGVTFPPDQIVWQAYNPYPKVQQFEQEREFVFIDQAAPGAEQPFNPADPVTSGLQQVLLLFAGSVSQRNVSDLKFEPLISTGDLTGEIAYSEIFEQASMFFGQPQIRPNRRRTPTARQYVLAARISGTPPARPRPADEQDAQPQADAAEETPSEVNVILVTDIDLLYSVFFNIRAAGVQPESEVAFQFDNVPFALNALDSLAGDDRFLEVRKRRPAHRTLDAVEQRTAVYREEALDAREQFENEFTRSRDEAQQKFEAEIQKLRERKDLDPQQLLIEVSLKQQVEQRRLDARIEQLERQRDESIKRAERKVENEIRHVQNQYKMWAVAAPPIPPLIVALIVFFSRRAREREGVSKDRLRR